jgi:DNA-binding transcriptional regulator YhcF (GntR family)
MSKTTSYLDQGDFDVVTSRSANADDANGVSAFSVQPSSKHEAAYRTLRRLITDGELRSERDFLLQPLAERLDVSRNTLTRALNRLVAEELVRHTPQKGYALLLPTAQQIERWYSESFDAVRNALVADDREKRSRQYGLDREEKLALAEILPEMAPPPAVVAELEELLRLAINRGGDAAKRSSFHTTLQKLASVRRVEHIVVIDHRDDVAQLMRSFYRGQYDRFLRMLGVYTAKRVRAAGSLASEVQLWVMRAEKTVEVRS